MFLRHGACHLQEEKRVEEERQRVEDLSLTDIAAPAEDVYLECLWRTSYACELKSSTVCVKTSGLISVSAVVF